MLIYKENVRNDFSDETLKDAFEVAEEHCENCGKELKWENQGRDNDDYWEAHHKDGNPKNNKPENCQILCYGCHKETKNFGKHK